MSTLGTFAFKSPELIFSEAFIKLIIGVVSLEAKLIEIIIDKNKNRVDRLCFVTIERKLKVPYLYNSFNLINYKMAHNIYYVIFLL